MNADKINQLRETADRLAVNSWPNASRLMVEAADELERLGKIEAAVRVFCVSTNVDDSCEAFDRMKKLVEVAE